MRSGIGAAGSSFHNSPSARLIPSMAALRATRCSNVASRLKDNFIAASSRRPPSKKVTSGTGRRSHYIARRSGRSVA
jgi:hypothetical protein